MAERYFEPEESLKKAARDPGWLLHWHDLAQDRLATTRKKGVDEEIASLRLQVALIDRIRELLTNA